MRRLGYLGTLLGHLFRGRAAPECGDAADLDDDGLIDISDAILILEHLFRSFHPDVTPAAGACGRDPTPDTMAACTTPGC